jgi:LPS-assembly protein
MFRIFFSFIFFIFSLKASIVLNADRFDYKDDIAYAYGDIVMRYNDSIFFAKKATYNRKTNVIILEGDVQIVGSTGFKVLADKVVFEAKNKYIEFSNFYGINQDDIWLYSQKATKKDKNINLRNSVLSSCSVKHPDWKVKFKEAKYDTSSKYMKLKDVKFYANEVPLFYTPYLAFSLNRERHSGFLMPVLSYSPDEGFIYEQPYFWAISKSQDLEFRPQIRTSRGYGIYNTYRFVDSPHSKGKLRFGYFHDYESYQKKFSLENQNHYGVEFIYENSDLLGEKKPEGYKDKLYINLNLFNDIDYINLQNRGLFNHLEETSRFKESRINYFLYSDRDFFGIRGRYFIDTTKVDNSQTIQELPSLNYHKFYSPIFGKFLSYSVDATLNNFYREDDPKAYQATFSLPVDFHTSLFNDYLNLSIEEEFEASDTHFTNGNIKDIKQNHYAAAVLHHKIELSSDLVKGYESGIHTMILSTSYSKTTKLAEGDLEFDEIDPKLSGDFNLDIFYDSKITLKMHHFWEPADGNGLRLDYLIAADYFPEYDSQWSLLRQNLNLKYGKYNLETKMDYSLEYDHITQLTNTLKYSENNLTLSISHNLQKDRILNKISSNDLTLDGSYKYSDNLTLYGGYSYDLKVDMSKKWKVGFLYDRNCWNFKLLFEQDITPVLTKNDKGSIRNNTISFQINLVPFGGVGTNTKALNNTN